MRILPAILLAIGALMGPVRADAIGTVDTLKEFESTSGLSIWHSEYWTARSETDGQTETIYLHPSDLLPAPKDSDYKFEDFGKKRLVHLQIVPKDSPDAPASMEAMRASREEELTQQGANFKFTDERYRFPALGSFRVDVEEPHEYTQFYTRTPEYFYILTGNIASGAAGTMSNILGDLYSHTYKAYPDWERPIRFSDPISIWRSPHWSGFLQPWFKSMVWRYSIALLLLLISWMGWFKPRFKYMGSAMLSFSIFIGLTAFILAYIPVLMNIGLWKNSAILSWAIIIPVPFFTRALSDRLGGRSPKSVFWSAAALSILIFYIGFEDAAIDQPPPVFLPLFALSSLEGWGFCYGLLFGVTFTRSPRQKVKKKV